MEISQSGSEVADSAKQHGTPYYLFQGRKQMKQKSVYRSDYGDAICGARDYNIYIYERVDRPIEVYIIISFAVAVKGTRAIEEIKVAREIVKRKNNLSTCNALRCGGQTG